LSSLADEVWERGDGLGSWNAEPVAEIDEEGDAELHAGLHQAEQDIASIASGLAYRSAGDFALGDEGADVVFGAVCVERDLGTVKNAQEFAFSMVKPARSRLSMM